MQVYQAIAIVFNYFQNCFLGKKQEAEKLIAEDYVTINADGVMEGKKNTM